MGYYTEDNYWSVLTYFSTRIKNIQYLYKAKPTCNIHRLARHRSLMQCEDLMTIDMFVTSAEKMKEVFNNLKSLNQNRIVRIDYEFSEKKMVAEVTLIFNDKIPVRVNILLNTYKIYEETHNWLWDLSFSRSVLEFKDIIAKKRCELSSNGQLYMP